MAARSEPSQADQNVGADSTLTILLAPRAALAGDLSTLPTLSRVLARADRSVADAGDEAQILRQFDILPRGLPIAALTRDFDARDAGLQTWLRADPAHVRADLGAGRLLACGDLGLSREEAEALVAPLKPVFGDAGCPISVGAESRWYVAVPRDSKLPAFAPPSRALGDDIYVHLPEGEFGRRWRHLLSEAQVILHNHPVNAARTAAGKLPVNSLWFWGAGRLPDQVRCEAPLVCSDDLLLATLCDRAGRVHQELPASFAALGDVTSALIDLRRVRDATALERDWIVPASTRLRSASSAQLRLDFADGALSRYRAAHRWRIWRRPLRSFA